MGISFPSAGPNQNCLFPTCNKKAGRPAGSSATHPFPEGADVEWQWLAGLRRRHHGEELQRHLVGLERFGLLLYCLPAMGTVSIVTLNEEK